MHNCINCQLPIISDDDFCSDECEKRFTEQNEKQRKIMSALKAICINASTEGCEDSAVVDLKLINEARTLLKLDALKPNGQ